MSAEVSVSRPEVIVVDTSVLVAILLSEPDAERFVTALLDADEILISASSLLETIVVATRRTGSAALVERLVASQPMTVVPFDSIQLEFARDGFARFGKGRHPAQLNFGDCFAYGLARSRGLPLLWNGDDFGLTDVIPAMDGESQRGKGLQSKEGRPPGKAS